MKLALLQILTMGLCVVVAPPVAFSQDLDTGGIEPETLSMNEDAGGMFAEIARELEDCEANNSALADMVLECRSAQEQAAPVIESIRPSQAENDCQDQLQLERSTNITILRDLEICRSAPPPNDQTAEIARLQTHIETLEAEAAARVAEIMALRTRIEDLGASVEPGFSYLTGTLRNSFVTLANLEEVPTQNRIARSRCPDIVAWMVEGAEGVGFFQLQAWVWDGTTALICSRDENGDVEVSDPTPTTSAHLVIYR
jgi:hypothetical protein